MYFVDKVLGIFLGLKNVCPECGKKNLFTNHKTVKNSMVFKCPKCNNTFLLNKNAVFFDYDNEIFEFEWDLSRDYPNKFSFVYIKHGRYYETLNDLIIGFILEFNKYELLL